MRRAALRPRTLRLAPGPGPPLFGSLIGGAETLGGAAPGAKTTKGGARLAAVTEFPGASRRSRTPALAYPAPDEV